MKKLLIIFFFLPLIINAQIDFTAAMGINVTSYSTFKDYVNVNFSSPNNQIQSFETGVEFLTEFDSPVSANWRLGLEYGLGLYSYNSNYGIVGNYDVSFLHHKPSVIGYYTLEGEGYKFKFGGGIGLRYVSLDEKLPGNANPQNYSTLGFGMVLKASGMTKLSGNLFAFIGTDLRYDLPGELESGSGKLYDNVYDETVTLNSISIGLKLGLTYTF